MLSKLRIQNFALIDHISLEFQNGFTVLTGETGSGKSILLGALNLILGERADYSVIGPASDKSIVEAEFELKNFDFKDFYQENDIDQEEITFIRREITSQGRSRAFINDTPVQLGVLKDFAEKLIHIHSQHNTIELKNPNFQMELLDVLADLQGEKNSFGTKFTLWNQKSKKLTQLQEQIFKLSQIADYNQFQIDEIKELNLAGTNYEELEKELLALESVDEIRAVLDLSNSALDGDEGAITLINRLKIAAEKSRSKDVVLDDLATRLQSVLIELKDIAAESDSHKESIEYNPFKISDLTSKLDKYLRVIKKHGLNNQADLQVYFDSLVANADSTEELKSEIATLENEIEILHKDLQGLAQKLHENRIEKAAVIAKDIQNLLDELKMPSTKLVFQLNVRKELNSNGCSDLTLLFSPNQGMEPVAIEKAASGGELSRLMLALQNLISKKKQLPAIIFDEIDTGVSGEVAQKIGNLLKNMGANLQLIAISHLPQVAAKAQNHFKVEKTITNNVMRTFVRQLNVEERVEEIARLMSGEQINEAALLNAEALMK